MQSCLRVSNFMWNAFGGKDGESLQLSTAVFKNQKSDGRRGLLSEYREKYNRRKIMASVPKVFIKIDSSAEQQETLNKSRKTLKVLQKTAVDKENLAGRPLHGKGFTKAKSDDFGVSELTKRKKIECKTTQTEAYEGSRSAVAVTEKDLTTKESPSEHYWEILAEKRRQALDETLGENRRLHERIEGLEDELNTSRKMLEEAKHLVEVLSEMLNENVADAAEEKGLLADDVSLNETIPELPEETDEEDE